MNERDKYLTEAMDICFHNTDITLDPNNVGYTTHWQCSKCGEYLYVSGNNSDFSTWQGFGLLLEWAQEQEWWSENFTCNMKKYGGVDTMNHHYINPDRLANAVYEFLKSRESEES